MRIPLTTQTISTIGLSFLLLGIAVVSSLIAPQVFAADPFGGTMQKRLSLYNGTLLLDGTAQLRLGNAGRDIESSGILYLRPDGSARGSFFSGVSNAIGQRLSLTGGISGYDAVRAEWAGGSGVNDERGALTGYFHGAVSSAVGAAIFGEVQSCGAGQTCYAGYFDGGQSTGLYVTSATGPNGVSQPTLQVVNNDANGVAGSFTGSVSAGRVTLDNNQRSACAWEVVSGNELVCSSDKLVAGVRASTADPTITNVYCCEL